MDWARLLPVITGTDDQELLLRNEYLFGEPEFSKPKLRAESAFLMPRGSRRQKSAIE